MKKIVLMVAMVLSLFANGLQRDAIRKVVIDQNTHLMWQDDASVEQVEKSWEGAKRFCANLSFAGFNDWRLPSRIELLSIADKSRYRPAIKKGFNPSLPSKLKTHLISVIYKLI